MKEIIYIANQSKKDCLPNFPDILIYKDTMVSGLKTYKADDLQQFYQYANSSDAELVALVKTILSGEDVDSVNNDEVIMFKFSPNNITVLSKDSNFSAAKVFPYNSKFLNEYPLDMEYINGMLMTLVLDKGIALDLDATLESILKKIVFVDLHVCLALEFAELTPSLKHDIKAFILQSKNPSYAFDYIGKNGNDDDMRQIIINSKDDFYIREYRNLIEDNADMRQVM